MDIPENSINEILENNPSQGTLHVLLAVMKDEGRYNLVIRECLKALSRFPEDLALRKILAESYLGERRFVEAEAEFSRVMDGIKNLAGVYRSRAEICVRQKREDEAAESLKKYLTFFPEDEEAAILLEELLATSAVSEIDSGEEHIDTEAAETAEPDETEIIEVQEPVEADIIETREPVEADNMEDQEPEEVFEIITASLAETYLEQGQLAEAREIYKKLAERDPEDASLKSKIDEISAMMEQKAEPDEPEKPEELKAEDTVRRKKERMISLLNSWRVNIKELAGESISE